jgi:hypothetical protein
VLEFKFQILAEPTTFRLRRPLLTTTESSNSLMRVGVFWV